MMAKASLAASRIVCVHSETAHGDGVHWAARLSGFQKFPTAAIGQAHVAEQYFAIAVRPNLVCFSEVPRGYYRVAEIFQILGEQSQRVGVVLDQQDSHGPHGR